MSGIGGIDSSVLLGFYQSQLTSSPSTIAAANAQNTAATQTNSATAKDNPPWNSLTTSSPAETAKVLSTTKFIDTTNLNSHISKIRLKLGEAKHRIQRVPGRGYIYISPEQSGCD